MMREQPLSKGAEARSLNLVVDNGVDCLLVDGVHDRDSVTTSEKPAGWDSLPVLWSEFADGAVKCFLKCVGERIASV